MTKNEMDDAQKLINENLAEFCSEILELENSNRLPGGRVTDLCEKLFPSDPANGLRVVHRMVSSAAMERVANIFPPVTKRIIR